MLEMEADMHIVRKQAIVVQMPARYSEQERKKLATKLYDQAAALDKTASEKSIDLYLRVVALDPEATGAMINIGVFYFETGEYGVAEKYFRKSIAIDPQYSLAHFNLASTLEEQGRFRKARHYYEQAIRFRQNYVDAHFNLGRLLYYTFEKPEEAKPHFEKCIVLFKVSGERKFLLIAEKEVQNILALRKKKSA